MKRRLIAFVASLLLTGLATSAVAQELVLRFQGRVAWIAGQTMILVLDNGQSISIDLVRVPQSDFQHLAPSNYVLVTGLILRGSRQVLATSIQPANPWYPQAP
jgi:hypothetical protein